MSSPKTNAALSATRMFRVLLSGNMQDSPSGVAGVALVQACPEILSWALSMHPGLAPEVPKVLRSISSDTLFRSFLKCAPILSRGYVAASNNHAHPRSG